MMMMVVIMIEIEYYHKSIIIIIVIVLFFNHYRNNSSNSTGTFLINSSYSKLFCLQKQTAYSAAIIGDWIDVSKNMVLTSYCNKNRKGLHTRFKKDNHMISLKYVTPCISEKKVYTLFT